MFDKFRAADPHSTPRVIATIVAMSVPFVYAVAQWAQHNSADTKFVDTPTLVETLEMNAVGAFAIYVIARTRFLAVFEHLEHLFSDGPMHKHRRCFGDAFWALVVSAASAFSGGTLIVQTLSPTAPGQAYTAHFAADIGTAQFYKSGYQALAIISLLALAVYVAIHYTKMSFRARRAGSPVRMPTRNAEVHSAKKGKMLAKRGNDVVVAQPNQDWTTTTRFG